MFGSLGSVVSYQEETGQIKQVKQDRYWQVWNDGYFNQYGYCRAMDDIGKVRYKPYHIRVNNLADAASFLQVETTVKPDKRNGPDKEFQWVKDFNTLMERF